MQHKSAGITLAGSSPAVQASLPSGNGAGNQESCLESGGGVTSVGSRRLGGCSGLAEQAWQVANIGTGHLHISALCSDIIMLHAILLITPVLTQSSFAMCIDINLHGLKLPEAQRGR